jgi:predicted transposase YdaD
MAKQRIPTLSRKRLSQVVRQFKENGIKLLLEHPQSVRELLCLTPGAWSQRIDFSRMRLVKTTFIRRDFRHVESDIVLVAPLLDERGRRTRKSVLIYVLIEHQSEPDRLMSLRMLDYSVQIYRYQVRQWTHAYGDDSDVSLSLVLPIVFYTGSHKWDSLGSLTDLIEQGSRYAELVPSLAPLYINLPALPALTLKRDGGYLGHVLRLVQQRRARPREFAKLLADVVESLEKMPPAERLRWLDLLSYLHAMIYHERTPAELEMLAETIEHSVATDDHRKEIHAMGQTIAEKLIEEGKKEGYEAGEIQSLRRTLQRLLLKRFGKQTDETLAIIEQTSDRRQLEEWLDRIVTAKSVQQIGIR